MTGLKSRYAYTIFEAQQKMGPLADDLYLIFLDIDTLKKINDTFGHVAGDETIVAVSKCIKNAFGDVAECFRMGGDEFLVAMTADEDIRMITVYQFAGTGIITAWVAPDVSHQDLHAFTFKETVKRMDKPQVVVVTVARDTIQRLELSDLLRKIETTTEVSGMPDLVNRLKKSPELIAEHPMSVRYKTYKHIKAL
jgi:GGDEF domain-containing protein